MRFSTFVIVTATFAVGAVGYASVFAATGTQSHGAGPAAWPTFVDSRNVIYMGPSDGLRNRSEEIQKRRAASRILAADPESQRPQSAAKRVASLGPTGSKSNLSTGSITTGSTHSRPTAPLPASAGRSLIYALDWSAFRPLLREPRKVAILLPRRKVLPAPRYERPAPRARRLLAAAKPVKARPSFDTSLRSSLGGPKPAEISSVANAREVTAPAALVRTASAAGLPASSTNDTGGYRQVAAIVTGSVDIVRSEATAPSDAMHHVAADPGTASQVPVVELPRIPAVEDGDLATTQPQLDTIAVRKAPAVQKRRARQARRNAQRRQARARQRQAQKRRSARRVKHAKRSRAGKYRRYQASRNRKIANQIRLRRRSQGIY